MKMVPLTQGGPGSPFAYLVGHGAITGDATGGHILSTFALPGSFAYAVMYSAYTRSNAISAPAPLYTELITGTTVAPSQFERVGWTMPEPAGNPSYTTANGTQRVGGMGKGPRAIFVPEGEAAPTLSIYGNNIDGGVFFVSFRCLLWDPNILRQESMGELLQFLP